MTAAVEQAWTVVDDTTAEIERARAALDALYDRRRAAFRVLLDSGEAQAAIARRARVTPMAVSYAVGNASKKRSTGTSTPVP